MLQRHNRSLIGKSMHQMASLLLWSNSIHLTHRRLLKKLQKNKQKKTWTEEFKGKNKPNENTNAKTATPKEIRVLLYLKLRLKKVFFFFFFFFFASYGTFRESRTPSKYTTRSRSFWFSFCSSALDPFKRFTFWFWVWFCFCFFFFFFFWEIKVIVFFFFLTSSSSDSACWRFLAREFWADALLRTWRRYFFRSSFSSALNEWWFATLLFFFPSYNTNNPLFSLFANVYLISVCIQVSRSHDGKFFLGKRKRISRSLLRNEANVGVFHFSKLFFFVFCFCCCLLLLFQRRLLFHFFWTSVFFFEKTPVLFSLFFLCSPVGSVCGATSLLSDVDSMALFLFDEDREDRDSESTNRSSSGPARGDRESMSMFRSRSNKSSICTQKNKRWAFRWQSKNGEKKKKKKTHISFPSFQTKRFIFLPPFFLCSKRTFTQVQKNHTFRVLVQLFWFWRFFFFQVFRENQKKNNKHKQRVAICRSHCAPPVLECDICRMWHRNLGPTERWWIWHGCSWLSLSPFSSLKFCSDVSADSERCFNFYNFFFFSFCFLFSRSLCIPMRFGKTLFAFLCVSVCSICDRFLVPCSCFPGWQSSFSMCLWREKHWWSNTLARTDRGKLPTSTCEKQTCFPCRSVERLIFFFFSFFSGLCTLLLEVHRGWNGFMSSKRKKAFLSRKSWVLALRFWRLLAKL